MELNYLVSSLFRGQSGMVWPKTHAVNHSISQSKARPFLESAEHLELVQLFISQATCCSVSESCLTLCNSGTAALKVPVLHRLPECAHTRVH